MGSVSSGLGADLSLPPFLSVTIGITKAIHGRKSRGKSFGTTLWHHVQMYCCLDVQFAHAQTPSNSSSYHIRGNEIHDSVTSFTYNMRADQSSGWLIRTSFPKSIIL